MSCWINRTSIIIFIERWCLVVLWTPDLFTKWKIFISFFSFYNHFYEPLQKFFRFVPTENFIKSLLFCQLLQLVSASSSAIAYQQQFALIFHEFHWFSPEFFFVPNQSIHDKFDNSVEPFSFPWFLIHTKSFLRNILCGFILSWYLVELTFHHSNFSTQEYFWMLSFNTEISWNLRSQLARSTKVAQIFISVFHFEEL